MENELYKQFYGVIIADAESGIKGGDLFLDFIRLDINIKNVKTLFRLRADGSETDAREMYIHGGDLSSADFAALNAIREQGEFVDMLKARIRSKPILLLLDEMKGDASVHRDMEVRLTPSAGWSRWSDSQNATRFPFTPFLSIWRRRSTKCSTCVPLRGEKNPNSPRKRLGNTW